MPTHLILGALLLVTGPAVTAAPAGDAATADRLAELYRRLDDLQTPAAPGTDPRSEEAVQKWTQITEFQNEIVRLQFGPEHVARYEEYRRKNAENCAEQVALHRDTALDTETRKTRLAELLKKERALADEYRGVIEKENAVRGEITARQYWRQSLQALKPILQATDEEWKALEPRLQEVVRLQQVLRRLETEAQGPGLYVNKARWEGPPVATTAEGALVAAAKAEKPAPEDLKAKMDALRTARAEAAAKRTTALDEASKKLKAAQEGLRKLVIARQETVLVVEGLLD